jgi:2-dehydro-3-deoxygluconokinase
MQVTSAESNALSVSSYLGLPALIITALVKDSPIADKIKHDLKSRGMDYVGPEIDPGGPWGFRHQINMTDTGYGLRGPRVHNDRGGEVARGIDVKDFDMDEIFGARGVKILHMSGLFAALSEQTGAFCLACARAAKKYGTLISFDLNYRASMWEGRTEELTRLFDEIQGVADIMSGIYVPGAEGKDWAVVKDMTEKVVERYQSRYSASVYLVTHRKIEDANNHIFGGMLKAFGEWSQVEPRRISVIDRIGSGDAFVGGMLYGILRGWTPDRWQYFGWASGVTAAGMLCDHVKPMDEESIWQVWSGNAAVTR